MNAQHMIRLLESIGTDTDAIDAGELDRAIADDEQQRIEDQAAQEAEWRAYGDDREMERGQAGQWGLSKYDLDPGVEYNDGGEPIGYM